ncbi:MAG: recombinase family protein [Clostridia bacterium]|nr:recombinase family protein [Clostridia bacterium]
MNKIDKTYKASIYLRLSKEDGDKEESYSISNQRDLCLDYLKGHPEIKLEYTMVDDGYTGSNFQRPDFQRMIDLISTGKVDCVIVKDLSRFARDYVGSGYYLEKLFPSMGVRFISINDNIDYMVDNGSDTKLIMAFKNVLNDSYIRDISVKIRSQFEIKRKKGEYIGAFVVFGYKKSEDDIHKLVVDKYAAEIVKNIFNQRMQGISASAIANKLNVLNVPSPAEYKKQCGSKFSANFQKRHEAKWSAATVIRILKNEIYTGTLIQGKHTTANYKVKKVITRDESEWVVIPNNHEAIITQRQFDTVQKIIGSDTRTTPGNTEPYLFSGFIECADCHSPLVRKCSRYNDKTYAYYMCSTNKLGLGCSSHRVSEDALRISVTTAINAYRKNVSDLAHRLNSISIEDIKSARLNSIEGAVKTKREEIKDLQHTVEVVKSRCIDNLETQEACNEICADIYIEIEKLEFEIEQLDNERKNVLEEYYNNISWIQEFNEIGELKELSRIVLAKLIDKIYIYENKCITIQFSYEEKFRKLLHLEEKIIHKEAI